MKFMNFILFITILGGTWQLGQPTCVLESDFGFILNCAFKKSGLFRVRNLGGVKAHIGLGFSVGDELGFKESISNVEINRRRSATASQLQAQLIQAQQQQNQQKASKSKANSIVVRSPTPVATIEAVPVPITGTMKKPSQSKPMVSVPPFKPIPPAPERAPVQPVAVSKPSSSSSSSSLASPAIMGSVNSKTSSSSSPSSNSVMAVVLPVSKVQAQDKMSSTNFALRTLATPNNELPPVPQTSSNSIHALLAANNVTEDALEQALIQRQQMLARMKTTTTTTTTPRPVTSKYANSVGKVMNAPKEYYPVGYDKNFDDNFASRVELPETSFYCGDQKHFPGLYADEDLGCMVFHVCALTDDGLIMKSFLCPESTLFDQTILKCNWWFYVDCKNSKKLYDSNIPISKSYQLMKALTFFSTYKKDSAPNKSKDKD